MSVRRRPMTDRPTLVDDRSAPSQTVGMRGEDPWSTSDPFGEALHFVQRVGELAETEGHHPDISFGWGYAAVSLQTKKIKGLHENDFILAAKVDRLVDGAKAS